MIGPVSLRLPEELAANLHSHLFPGDGEEHGAVVGATVVKSSRGVRLLGRRLFLAADGTDYAPSQRGYRMLKAEFVLECALSCADEGLAYFAVHNHGGTDRVAFSCDDLASHRRGYPALIELLDGPPVGALVFAERAVAGDIWLSPAEQTQLEHTIVVGDSQHKLYPYPRIAPPANAQFDRQVQLFGDRGQEILAHQKVGIVGAGGAGSLINEYLSRLGVGNIVIVDYDRLEGTNYPRVVGARPSDLRPRLLPRPLAKLLGWKTSHKVVIAKRVARDANPSLMYEAVVGDVTFAAVAERLLDCDAIFLAADSMQSRLLVNALCHQYLIPTWQVGAKVVSDSAGSSQDVFSVVRPLVPGKTCLWCNELVDPTRLAEEAASQRQREAQRYVDEVPNPSVISLNAVASAHAVDQYLFSILGLKYESDEVCWTKFLPLSNERIVERPRRSSNCLECHGRLAAGRQLPLPVRSTSAE